LIQNTNIFIIYFDRNDNLFV